MFCARSPVQIAPIRNIVVLNSLARAMCLSLEFSKTVTSVNDSAASDGRKCFVAGLLYKLRR